MPTTAVGIYGIKGKDAGGGGDRTVFSHPVTFPPFFPDKEIAVITGDAMYVASALDQLLLRISSSSSLFSPPLSKFLRISSLLPLLPTPRGQREKERGAESGKPLEYIKANLFPPPEGFSRERDRKIEVKSPRFSVTAAFCVHSSSFVHMRYFVQKRTTRVSQVTRSALMEALRLFPYFSPSPIS